MTALHAKQSSSSHKYGPGVKHVNTAIACQTLEVVYLATNKPADTGLAVSLLIQPDKIQRRVSDDDKDLALSMSQSLRAAQVAQARFEEGSVLSAVPWCWAPTSRHDDNKDGATVCWAADAQWQERQPKHVVRGDAARPAPLWPFQRHGLGLRCGGWPVSQNGATYPGCTCCGVSSKDSSW